MNNQLTNFVAKNTMKIQKHSPEILMVAGVASIVGGTILACRATLKVDNILYEASNKLDQIDTVNEAAIRANVEGSDQKIDYGPDDATRDKTIVYVQTGLKMAKNYLPAATLLIFGLTCVLGSHGIMKKRNVAVMAAFKGAEEAFEQYRARVTEELGEDKDRHFRYGTKSEEIEVTSTDDKGKEKTEKKNVEVVDPNGLSQYAKFFDESCPDWKKSADHNFTFLKCQQAYANDMLHARGHVFLNEVYDLIGVPRTQAGSIVGWVKGEGDDFIDFGIFDRDRQQVRDFVNGYERSILLDFNVSGVIYDLI